VSEGKCLADNLLASLDGKARRPFSFSALGMMGSLGHQSAVGDVLGIKLSGIFAWFMWRTIYWMKLPGLRRKFYVAIDWFLNLIMPKEIVQLNVAPSESLTREHFEANEVVFRQGDLGDRVYIILDGEVEVIRENAQGHETILARLKANDCFGEMALIKDDVRNATVRTVTHLNTLTLPRGTFTTLFDHIPALRDSLEQLVQEREQQLGELDR
jgi:NADH dehydrogenase